MRADNDERLIASIRARARRRSSRIATRVFALLLVVPAIATSATANADPKETVKRSSSHSTVWFGRNANVSDAVSAWRQGRTDFAVEAALAALETPLTRRDERTAASVVCMGLTANGAAEDAVAYCERALRHGGAQDWRHVNNLANALYGAGRHDEAIAQYERAIALVSESTSRHGAAERERIIAEVLTPNLALAHKARRDALTPSDAPTSEVSEAPDTRLAVSPER